MVVVEPWAPSTVDSSLLATVSRRWTISDSSAAEAISVLQNKKKETDRGESSLCRCAFSTSTHPVKVPWPTQHEQQNVTVQPTHLSIIKSFSLGLLGCSLLIGTDIKQSLHFFIEPFLNELQPLLGSMFSLPEIAGFLFLLKCLTVTFCIF